ncbi:MAG: CoA-binding protein [Planctomycetota bacterium]
MSDRQPTVAIIGASRDPAKPSHESVLAHASCGYRVFPINPSVDRIAGHEAYARVEDVPVQPLDRVSIYVPPTVGIELIDAIAAVGCVEFWLNPGAESDALIARAEALGLTTVVACSLIDCRNRER